GPEPARRKRRRIVEMIVNVPIAGLGVDKVDALPSLVVSYRRHLAGRQEVIRPNVWHRHILAEQVGRYRGNSAGRDHSIGKNAIRRRLARWIAVRLIVGYGIS